MSVALEIADDKAYNLVRGACGASGSSRDLVSLSRTVKLESQPALLRATSDTAPLLPATAVHEPRRKTRKHKSTQPESSSRRRRETHSQSKLLVPVPQRPRIPTRDRCLLEFASPSLLLAATIDGRRGTSMSKPPSPIIEPPSYFAEHPLRIRPVSDTDCDKNFPDLLKAMLLAEKTVSPPRISKRTRSQNSQSSAERSVASGSKQKGKDACSSARHSRGHSPSSTNSKLSRKDTSPADRSEASASTPCTSTAALSSPPSSPAEPTPQIYSQAHRDAIHPRRTTERNLSLDEVLQMLSPESSSRLFTTDDRHAYVMH